MRGKNGMGLPSPTELDRPEYRISEIAVEQSTREQHQIAISEEIIRRGVGKAQFDEVGGWDVLKAPSTPPKRFSKACSEWADGELVAAHRAYRNDILCTNDEGKNAGNSILNTETRTWLIEKYGVKFLSLSDLHQELSK